MVGDRDRAAACFRRPLSGHSQLSASEQHFSSVPGVSALSCGYRGHVWERAMLITEMAMDESVVMKFNVTSAGICERSAESNTPLAFPSRRVPE